ncbi:hypothetical protein BaRGS_00015849 [Batillaria attramentaria]|uniref:Uncharacterized protein n=1 Tax=Batillaria attramentaria TaxID=370345 RepID=A0ABD0L0H2_9CAEN
MDVHRQGEATKNHTRIPVIAHARAPKTRDGRGRSTDGVSYDRCLHLEHPCWAIGASCANIAGWECGDLAKSSREDTRK